MNRRGHVLALLILIIATIGAAGTVFFSRLSVDQLARKSAALRTQTLWLGRSALAAEVRGSRQVETAQGPALVRVESVAGGWQATVELAGARAEVGPDAERYQAPLTP